jgi:hypothetical protein
MTELPVMAIDRLGVAFAARDTDGALGCFIPGDDIAYVGSETGECADGRIAVAALFTELFGRPEVYSWRVENVWDRQVDHHAYVLAEVTLTVRPDIGSDISVAQDLPYRLSGLLALVDGRWRWQICQGSEPTSS